MSTQGSTEIALRAYQDSYAHLQDELGRLDALIQQRVAELRCRLAATRGVTADPNVAISHEEIDRLLEASEGPIPSPLGGRSGRGRGGTLALRAEIDARLRASAEQRVFLSLPALAHTFALSSFEVAAVVICLAPELDRKYDRLYAYLQDDITRKRPSADLILDLLCRTDAERWSARRLLSEEGRLLRAGILSTVEDPQSPSGASGLARFLKLDQRILGYILGDDRLDARLGTRARLLAPAGEVAGDATVADRVMNLVKARLSVGNAAPRKLVLHLRGGYGAGGHELALYVCGEIGRGLLLVDTELVAAEPDAEGLLCLAFRESLLRQCAVYLDNVDALRKEDGGTYPLLKNLPGLVSEYGWLTFLGGERPWAISERFEGAAFQEIVLPTPDVPQRAAVWRQALEGIQPEWAEELSRRFRLTPGQIRDAVADAGNRLAMRGGRDMALADLYQVCRARSDSNLGALAVKTEPRYGWDDLVQPAEQVAQLREVCSHVRHSYRVFSQWGFQGKVGYGRGVSALFSGPPGTGKTMAAQVIAGELGLDLYRVDLSSVVSKYIGETEKNLSSIFKEAETSNAILFFDEADALFGKRTEISDAHDRYANIETSYLLQKMEEYEGVVLLSTNLRENMDEAFTRRIRFIVEFPFPDVPSRRRIWQGHFPREAPVGELDYDFLAKEFAITGGSIRNVILSAAFYAAESGQVIGMDHVLRGIRREYEKIGKVWSEPRSLSWPSPEYRN